jgi:hypothetical protein
MLLLGFSAFAAFGTGFWLLFRLTYVLALALPACWLIAWYNTRHLDVFVERRTDRAQVGQHAQEVIEIRNRDLFPKLWLEVEDPSELPGHRSRRVVVVPPRRSRNWMVDTPLTRRGLYDWGRCEWWRRIRSGSSGECNISAGGNRSWCTRRL